MKSINMKQVQHELTPKLEDKIGSLFKKLIKTYVFAFLSIIVIGIVIFLLYYSLVVKPNMQRATDAQNKFFQLQEESRKKFEQKWQSTEQ